MTEYPNATRLIYELIKRRVVSTDAGRGLSEHALIRIECGLTPRRDVVWLLRARDAEARRNTHARRAR